PARRARLSAGRRAALAALALVAGAGLSETLIAAGPLYDHYAHVADRPFGLTQATDQSRAALLMMAEQVATLGVATALLLRRHVGTERRPAPLRVRLRSHAHLRRDPLADRQHLLDPALGLLRIVRPHRLERPPLVERKLGRACCAIASREPLRALTELAVA